jgi:hypothetical protein
LECPQQDKLQCGGSTFPQQDKLQCGGSRSVKARGDSRWWQKWELEGKLPSPLPLLYFPVKKMTTMSPLSSFVSSCFEKENDESVVIGFIYLVIFIFIF